MSESKMTLFIVPPHVAAISGRYVCLLPANRERGNRYLAEDSLVELSRLLGDEELDWNYIEVELNKSGVYHST